MTFTTEQLRAAFADLNGRRNVTIEFRDHAVACEVKNALLVPMEQDHIVKITDGTREYLLDAESIAWVRIG